MSALIRPVSRNTLEQLASHGGAPCVSLYLPTFRSGERVREGPIRLKNLIGEATQQLQRRDWSAGRELLDRARDLLPDSAFWQHQGEGLALFLAADGLQQFRVPVALPEQAAAGRRFLLRPLLAAVSEHPPYHVLALGQNRLRLIRCDDGHAEEVDRGPLPASLEDALGTEVEAPSLQFHTGTPASSGPRRAAIFHGQGRGSDDSGEELERYLRVIDDGLRQRLPDPDAPIVIAAVDYLIPKFQQLTRHPAVLAAGLPGNPEHLDAHDLRSRTHGILRARQDELRRAALRSWRELAHTERACAGVTEIVRAAAQARVETLFVRPDAAVFGCVDQDMTRVVVHEERAPADDDLADLAIHHAIRSGARVLAVPAGELPENRSMVATLRY